MTDTEKMYAYEMQRRQTIGNYLNRINNLGYGNATGAPFNVDYDDTYSLDDSTSSDIVPQQAPSPKSVEAPAPEVTEEPAAEDPDLEINPSEEDPVEDPFKDFEG